MNTTFLSALIFVGVFAAVILVHEFGHFVVARLLGVEVEEFGIGLPPRITTFWRGAGYLSMQSGKRIEIPRTFNMPFEWSRLLGRELRITVQQMDGKLVLNSIETTLYHEKQRSAPDLLSSDHILVDEKGQVIDRLKAQRVAEQKVLGRHQAGELELTDAIAQAHPGTAFTLNWLPIGGFVRPKGENDPNIPGGLAAASPWTRLAVLLAGPTMNLIMAIIVFSALVYQMGIPDYTKVQIEQVVPNSPAARAGIQANDIVASVNGQVISNSGTLHDVIYANLDKPVTIVLQRGNQTITITATPLSSRPADQGALGISMGPELVRYGSPVQALGYGSLTVYTQARMLIALPAQLILGQVSSDQARFVGLKGIYDLFGQAVNRDVQSRAAPSAPGQVSPAAPAAPETPTYFTAELIGILAVSIGVFNLFPFPALDGGRIFFVLVELIIRRRVPSEFENYVHLAGFTILILFMIYVNAMDFIHPAIINLP